MHGQRKDVDRALKRIIQDGKNKYLPIVTGHQGEPGSILVRIANGETPYTIEPGDRVIFSANVIPSPMTQANRYALETKLKMRGARIYDNVHVSGHAYREDHWELLRMVNPEHEDHHKQVHKPVPQPVHKPIHKPVYKPVTKPAPEPRP